ncbi:MAG: hypothetical protein HF967_02770 [Methanosarcinales archaeon]|nr:hypothetical protein [Methanosarcinales archaeon]
MSLKRLVEELDGIRIALVKSKMGKKQEMIFEEMDVKQAQLFSLLNLEKYMLI